MTIKNIEEFKDEMGIIDEGPIVELSELEGGAEDDTETCHS